MGNSVRDSQGTSIQTNHTTPDVLKAWNKLCPGKYLPKKSKEDTQQRGRQTTVISNLENNLTTKHLRL
jgi:hypothetical protein